MSRLQEIISTLEETARHPYRSVEEAIRSTGRKAVGCFPLYTPEELIYAAGLLPVGMWGAQTEIKLSDQYLQSFCCSIMRANLELGMNGTYKPVSAVIIPTFCDTLKCICENWKAGVPNIALIPMVYPQNRNTEAGVKYLQEELLRIKAELERVSGTLITEEAIESSFALYEEYRKAMRRFTAIAGDYPITIHAKTRHLIIKAAYFTDKAKYTALINELTDELERLPAESESYDGIKVVATGILSEPEILLDLFVENKIAFAADDLAQESRQFRTLARKEGTALEKIAYRMADQRGCPLLFEETKTRGQMLIDEVKESHADGVVIFMLKFCDPEEFDYPIYKRELEGAGIPMLYIEIEQNMKSVEQQRTRIQSFVEMIKS